MLLQDFFSSKRDTLIDAFREEFLMNEYSLHYNSPETLESLIDKVIVCVDAISSQSHERVESAFENFSKINLELGIPFVVSAYQINFIKDSVAHAMIESAEAEHIVYMCKAFDNIFNVVSRMYLESYMTTLHTKNTMRLKVLDSLLDSELIEHFHRHLDWLNCMVDAIETKNPDQIPEQDATLCLFGQWLHGKGNEIIYEEPLKRDIHQTHNDLHLCAKVIFKLLKKQKLDYHKICIYLQKAELYSINIGNSLALISNIILNKTSSRDTLTGTLNRTILDKIFKTQMEIAKATESCFSIVMADLDYFKKINDQYGHIAGDRVLKMFAELLKSKLRESDFIFRYGGEEFLLILPATCCEKAKQIMEKIRQTLEDRICSCVDSNVDIKLTASFGVSEICPDFTDETDSSALKRCIKQADDQLYLAKHSGRNQVM